MKRIFCLIGLLASTPFFLSLAPDMLVSFTEQSSWNSAQSQAMNENKLFFVDFDASYCAACRKMDQSTFMDASLANYMKDNVTALKVDVQDIDGMRWSQQYEIEALPTMLVFNEEGKLAKRLTGYQSAEELMTVFKGLKKDISYQPASQDQPLRAPAPQVEQPEASNESTPTPSTASSTTSAASNTTSSQAMTAPKTPFKEEGIYELKVRKANPQGYSVQVGVFGNYENVIELAEKIGAQSQQKTFVQVERLNGQTLYRLLVGLFPARRQASVMRNNLIMKGYDAIIHHLGEEALN